VRNHAPKKGNMHITSAYPERVQETKGKMRPFGGTSIVCRFDHAVRDYAPYAKNCYYNEKATIPNKTKNIPANNIIEINFIHPVLTISNEIAP